MGIKFIDDEKCNEYTRTIINFVNCPHKIISENSDVEDVNAEYEKAVIRGKKEGFVPVLVSADSVLAEWFSFDDDSDYSKEKILEDVKKETRSGSKLLEEKCKLYFDDYDEDYEDFEDYKQYLEDDFWEDEEDDEEEDSDLLCSFTDNETILFEIPVKNPWEVIAWLPFGGWNECPEPVEMMMICHYWYDEYKAVPAVISHDTMEFILEKPISDEETAWEVAKQHCVFCSECIESGSLCEVTDSILDSKVWYFWWD